MKDFTLPRREFEIKLSKCGLLALILIRTVLFKPVFLQDQAISLKSDPSKLQALLRRIYIHERFHPPPQRFWDKIVQIWIIGPDSYPHSPLQASFTSRSSHIVGIGSESIVGIVM